MNVVIGWLRLELPRRWRSLVVLALLIAVASGTVMTALAGARRNATAVDRFEARTRPATAAILANTRGFDWSKVRPLPEVDAFTTFGPTFTIEGLPPGLRRAVQRLQVPPRVRRATPGRPDS